MRQNVNNRGEVERIMMWRNVNNRGEVERIR